VPEPRRLARRRPTPEPPCTGRRPLLTRLDPEREREREKGCIMKRLAGKKEERKIEKIIENRLSIFKNYDS
jgi:hypothetical protein